MTEYFDIDVRMCAHCERVPEVVAWPQYEIADVVCRRCGRGITGWPVEDVVKAWDEHQVRVAKTIRRFVVYPPDHPEAHTGKPMSQFAAGQQQPQENDR